MSSAAGGGRSQQQAASRSSPGRVAAFFDMDKTLIAENSGSIYMKRRFEQGEIDSWQLTRALLAYFQYKIGALDVLAWTQAETQAFEGRPEADLEAEGRKLYEEVISGQVYPEARSCIRAHQEQGDVVCIVSGTTKFLIEPL
ncbi:MAG: HAD family hydrolase, partial [Myxococcota bacterium]